MGGTDWGRRYRFHVFLAYFSGLNFRGYPHKIWSEKWYMTSILRSWNSHWSSRLGKRKKIARWDHPHLTSNQGTRLMCRSLMALFRIALFRVALGTDVSQGSTLMKCEPLDRPNIQAVPSAGINGNSRILKWRSCTIFQTIFWGVYPLTSP